jgi:hypothetical protein
LRIWIVIIIVRNTFIIWGDAGMRLQDIIRQITEKVAARIMAKKSGLGKKPGYGNYGTTGPYITHRSIKGQLKPVVPHRIGQKPTLTGKAEPLIRFPGQPQLREE